MRAEEARSRVLLDLIATGHAVRTGGGDVDLDLERQEKELEGELAGIEKSLAAAATY